MKTEKRKRRVSVSNRQLQKVGLKSPQSTSIIFAKTKAFASNVQPLELQACTADSYSYNIHKLQNAENNELVRNANIREPYLLLHCLRSLFDQNIKTRHRAVTASTLCSEELAALASEKTGPSVGLRVRYTITLCFDLLYV